jgi:hypothetical protein
MNKSEIVRQLLQQSPFLAFPKEELERIDQRYRSQRKVYVRFGYQWKDNAGNPQKDLSIALRDKLRELFAEAQGTSSKPRYALNYASLRAQAGKPVLHKIVFDILSADLLFFDVTYINANVFFELGIAYAANMNLFLLRREGSSHQVPSDLSGLTYCSYLFDRDFRIDSSAERDIKSAMRRILQNKAHENLKA